MLTIEGKLLNVISTKSRTDKVTGEVTPPGHQVQIFYEMPAGAEGTEKKFILDDFNVHQNGAAYQKCVNKVVRVPVGVFVKDTGGLQFYIPKGGLPTVVGTAA